MYLHQIQNLAQEAELIEAWHVCPQHLHGGHLQYISPHDKSGWVRTLDLGWNNGTTLNI